MTDIVTASSKKPDSWNDAPWYEGTHGERIAVRLPSLDTNGAYAIVESIAAPGWATKRLLLAVSGETATPVRRQGGWAQFELKSILDHELAIVE